MAPVLRAKPEAWQGEWTSFEAFQRVCGVVQSRTFHLQEDNWLTGTSIEGKRLPRRTVLGLFPRRGVTKPLSNSLNQVSCTSRRCQGAASGLQVLTCG